MLACWIKLWKRKENTFFFIMLTSKFIYMMLIHEICIFEPRIEANFDVYDPRSF